MPGSKELHYPQSWSGIQSEKSAVTSRYSKSSSLTDPSCRCHVLFYSTRNMSYVMIYYLIPCDFAPYAGICVCARGGYFAPRGLSSVRCVMCVSCTHCLFHQRSALNKLKSSATPKCIRFLIFDYVSHDSSPMHIPYADVSLFGRTIGGYLHFGLQDLMASKWPSVNTLIHNVLLPLRSFVTQCNDIHPNAFWGHCTWDASNVYTNRMWAPDNSGLL